ncbi:polyprenyl synthetase family protein, partial [Acinetobacter baumannii]|uniref:polyprenyl synthetase family protein n=1 Tax=Acinetobacter baumannii TaxID=470 RepID=UPI001899F91B
VMAGDFLLARVLRVLARTGNHDFTMLMSDAAAAIVEAEILQYQLADTEEYSFESYLRVIDGKTGVLISAALEGVAVLAGTSAGERAALREFGLRYGRAFQLQDDYLDLFASERELGKPVGNDLREGKATWPVLLLLQSGNREATAI